MLTYCAVLVDHEMVINARRATTSQRNFKAPSLQKLQKRRIIQFLCTSEINIEKTSYDFFCWKSKIDESFGKQLFCLNCTFENVKISTKVRTIVPSSKSL